MNRWVYAVPAVLLLGFGALAAQQLLVPDKGDFERISRSAPKISFETLSGETIRFAPPPNGDPIVVNLFASWCGPCEIEHPQITALSKQYPGQVYGVLYKDEIAAGEEFLAELGNPYTKIALDPDGQGGLDFGLTGVPETFVISASGEILLHVPLPLDDASRAEVSEALQRAPR